MTPFPSPGSDRRARGQLRVYLSALPGIGEAETLLADGRQLRDQGRDVLVAAVDLPLSADAALAAPGLECLADAAGTAALPVDHILSRRPALLLVADLGRRNPEACRHRHRWEDIEEILDNGIDVLATLSILNIEELRTRASELAHTPLRSFVPDAFLAAASDIVLVDLAPELMLARVRAATTHHDGRWRLRGEGLTLANVSALRDLALQWAARHAEERRIARQRRAGAPAAAAVPNVLVYVERVAEATALIQAGRRLAMLLHADWILAYREARELRPQGRHTEQLQRMLQLAEGLGAPVLALSAFGAGRRVVDLVRRQDACVVVLARPPGDWWQGRHDRAVVRALQRGSPPVDVLQIAAEASLLARDPPALPAPAALPAPVPASSGRAAAVGWALAVPALATVVSTTLFRDAQPTNHLIVYLLGVIFVASRHGFWASAIAAILSVLASDFLLIAPVYSFAVARPQDLVTLAVFLVAAIVASRLADNLRFQGARALEREQRVRFLYEFTRALAGAQSLPEVAAETERHIRREFPWRCGLYFADADARLQFPPAPPATGAPAVDPAMAQRAFDSRRAAGWGTSRQARESLLYLPVSGPAQRFGVLAIEPLDPARPLAPEQRRVVETLVSQVAQTLERIRLTGEALAAQAMAQTESLRNSLLNAIAHDFRTPLASIVAASSTLAQEPGRLSAGQARELAQAILEEGQRMATLANNTLEMARLEAGNVPLRREWYPLDEIVGAALTSMGARLRAHPVRTATPPGAAMAQVDLVMIVRVLENLIENAVKYSPEAAPIDVGAEEQDGHARFWVADRGPGLQPGEESMIFAKFYRGRGKETRSGVGLGLTICRIIVEAHGGTITAGARPGGGALFGFTVPGVEPRPSFRTDE